MLPDAQGHSIRLQSLLRNKDGIYSLACVQLNLFA
jgi:hypothetical protein